jgi:hypothetical protein
MPDTQRPPAGPRRPYPATKARQGEIILKSPWQRAVFIAGLAGVLVIGLAITFLLR